MAPGDFPGPGPGGRLGATLRAQWQSRRDFIGSAIAGTLLVALGGEVWALATDEATQAARKQTLADGRPRLPPGQRVIHSLKPMGGEAGSPDPRQFRLRVHGAVKRPFELDFAGLLAMTQVTQSSDVHCVTGWSALDQRWLGVRVSDLAARAEVRASARYVIFEAAQGYNANVRLAEAMASDTLVAHRLNGQALSQWNGAPVRALVPGLYFWKSAKWLTGIRFSERDERGFWEARGYHNHADPWREERHG